MRAKARQLNLPHGTNKNSSEDEIANVNLFYDDTLHALQNIDRC